MPKNLPDHWSAQSCIVLGSCKEIVAGKFSGDGAVNLEAVNPNPGAVTWSRRQAAGGSWRCSPATGELRHRARRAWMNSVGARRGPPLFCLMCVACLR